MLLARLDTKRQASVVIVLAFNGRGARTWEVETLHWGIWFAGSRRELRLNLLCMYDRSPRSG